MRVTSADHTGRPDHVGPSPDLLIGAPEREAARLALETHLIEQRLDAADHERRLQACDSARTQSELRRIFHDLPAPHPDLPSLPVAPAVPKNDDDEDIPALAISGCLLLGLGIPVAIVLGFVYGAWWALVVPVLLTAALAHIDRLPGRNHARSTERGETDERPLSAQQ